MDKKEILNEWLRQTDQTYINEGHKIVILNAMEEYAMQQVKNCSIPDVRLSLPSDDEITEEIKKLPYTKHLDDGRYNDGVITGFEMGAEYVLKWCRSNKA